MIIPRDGGAGNGLDGGPKSSDSGSSGGNGSSATGVWRERSELVQGTVSCKGIGKGIFHEGSCCSC